MKKLYKAAVTDKFTGERQTIEFESKSKADFKNELGHNGFRVYYNLIEESAVFDWILDNTNAEPWRWAKYRKMAVEELSK